jgi:hypothetical protein
VGDLPALAYAFRLNREGANPVNASIAFYNNLWSDPTGTMGAGSSGGNDFSDGAPGEVTGLALTGNLYWNGPNPIPAGDQVNPLVDDAARIVADPQLTDDYTGLVLPRYGGTGFQSGSATIRDEFERLALAYGTLGAGSPAVDAAQAAQSPADDLLGNPRGTGGGPDLGAVEAQGYGFQLSANPSTLAIAPGGQAVFALAVERLGAFSETVTLLAASPSLSLTVTISPATVLPPASAVLTATSQHLSPLQPGAWWNVPITAAGGGITETLTLSLLVGGARIFLPVAGR